MARVTKPVADGRSADKLSSILASIASRVARVRRAIE
jgi:hypothetical protein